MEKGEAGSEKEKEEKQEETPLEEGHHREDRITA